MSNKEKSINIIECSGKKTDLDSWWEKFLLHGKWKSNKKLLVRTRSIPGMDKIPTQEEYEGTCECNEVLDKKIVK